MNRSLAAAFAVLTALALGACSGGGGNPTPTPAANATDASAASTATPKAAGAGVPMIRTVTFVPAQALNSPIVTDSIRAQPDAVDPDGDGVLFDYRWFVSGREIAGESSDTIRPVPGRWRKGDKIEVQVIPKDTRGNTGLPFNAFIMMRDAIPSITSRPTGSLNGYRATVADADIGDPNERFTWSLEPPLPGFSISQEGVLSFDPVAGKEANGKNITIVVTDSAGSLAKQTFDVRF